MAGLAVNIELYAAVLAALSATGGLVYWLWKVASKVNNSFLTMDRIAKIVDAEFKPNGGSSARDALDRIENSLVLLAQNDEFILIESGVATFSTDAEGLCNNVNREYCRLTGRAEGECLGNGWINNLHPEDQHRVVVSWEEHKIDRREWYIDSFSFLHTDGKAVKCRLRGYPMRDRNGNFSGYKGFIRRTGGD